MFSVEELKAKAPAVFRTAEEGAKAGASKHYQFIPTVDVIDDLSKFGWNIHDVGQQSRRPALIQPVTWFVSVTRTSVQLVLVVTFQKSFSPTHMTVLVL